MMYGAAPTARTKRSMKLADISVGARNIPVVLLQCTSTALEAEKRHMYGFMYGCIGRTEIIQGVNCIRRMVLEGVIGDIMTSSSYTR